MNCKDLNEKLDDYMDGSIDEAGADALSRHAESCDGCRVTLERERELRGLLKGYPMVRATTGFYDRALLRAAHRGTRRNHTRNRNRWLLTGFGSAMAAGLAIWMISAMLLSTPQTPDAGSPIPGATIPGVTIALDEPRTVKLMFASANALDSAMLTVTLPDGIELEGFPGRREISWETSLQQGRNVLPLTLVAVSPMGGELLARLEHDDRDRTFRLRVDVS